MKKANLILIIIIIYLDYYLVSLTFAQDKIPVASPMIEDLVSRSGIMAVQSVFRVLCPSKNRSGTGFLHKSGKIITTAHVVAKCDTSELVILNFKGNRTKIVDIKIDKDRDLALLTPKAVINAEAFEISKSEGFLIGIQISTWGYPSGYKGLAPLLSSGYLSGIDFVVINKERKILKWVVNAAFNLGNSGGPLIDIKSNTVFGVVSSKLAPIPQYIESALQALKKQESGLRFEGTKSDGTKISLSQSQVLEQIIQYLRSQTQLVIGYAVTLEDLKKFLMSNGINP